MLKTNLSKNSFLFTFIILGSIIAYSLWVAAYPAFIFPWYANTEEFAYIQEIIRFVDFVFRQQFFDIPGTPLMIIGAFFWFIYYQFSILLSFADPALGIRHFSFEHMQQLYTLMRSLSYLFYAISIVLTFAIAQRLSTTIGGYIAALLLALSPVYSFTILHLRIEPTSLTFVLLSVWLVLLAISSHKYSIYLASGICSGLAMATRFPSLLACFSVVLAYCVIYPEIFQEQKQRRWNTYLLVIGLLTLNLSGLIVLLAKLNILSRNLLTDLLLITAEGNYPNATSKIQDLWLFIFAITSTLSITYIIPKSRRIIQPLIYSSILTVCFGCFIGFLLGVPTLLWSGNYFLASVEMFIDRNQVGQTFIHNFWDMLYFFLFGLPPWRKDTIVQPNESAQIWFRRFEAGVLYTYWHAILFTIGLLIIFCQTYKRFYPFLFGIMIGITSQYGKLQTIRHLIAWLPYFLIITALPPALLYEKLIASTALIRRRWSLNLFTLFTLSVLFLGTYSFQVDLIRFNEKQVQEKLYLSSKTDLWIAENINNSDKVFHTCCEPINQEVVLDWMQRNGVVIPAGIRKTDNSIIWFGDKESLVQAGKGFIVISTATYPSQYINYYKKIAPERLIDPFRDPHFVLKATINPARPEKTTSYQIYAFDFTKG